jgi:hypothetical protein
LKLAPDEMRQQIDNLAKLPRAELAERWHGHYGCPPPKGVKRSLLERSLAWHVQANAFGGLDRRTLRVLREAGAESFSDGYDQPQKPETDKRPRTPASAKPPLVGTRLMRDWHGSTHVVDVVEGGFAWRGEVYSSLSAVAREITGARWSGPRFFGL